MAKNMGREARILKKRRIELGLTQNEIAEAIGVQLQQYQMFEYGTYDVAGTRRTAQSECSECTAYMD